MTVTMEMLGWTADLAAAFASLQQPVKGIRMRISIDVIVVNVQKISRGKRLRVGGCFPEVLLTSPLGIDGKTLGIPRIKAAVVPAGTADRHAVKAALLCRFKYFGGGPVVGKPLRFIPPRAGNVQTVRLFNALRTRTEIHVMLPENRAGQLCDNRALLCHFAKRSKTA